MENDCPGATYKQKPTMSRIWNAPVNKIVIKFITLWFIKKESDHIFPGTYQSVLANLEL